MASFLEQTGYTFTHSFGRERNLRHWSETRCIYMVCTWKKPGMDGKVDIIVSASNRVLDVIRRFHSTHVMNFATYDRVFVMYPELTCTRVSVINTDVGRMPHSTYRKYTARGIRFASSNTGASVACGLLCPALLRGPSRPGTYIDINVCGDDLSNCMPHIDADTLWRTALPCGNKQCISFEQVRADFFFFFFFSFCFCCR